MPDFRVVGQVLDKGGGGCTAKREVMMPVPIAGLHFLQRRQRKGVDRGLGNRHGITGRGGGRYMEAIPFVAALHILPEIAGRAAHTGEPGFSVPVMADKGAVVILFSLIKRPGLYAQVDNLPVYATALQISNGADIIAVARRRGERGLDGRGRRSCRFEWAGNGNVATKLQNGVGEAVAAYLCKIIQRAAGLAAEVPAVPAPFSVAYNKAVVVAQNISVRALLFQIFRFVFHQVIQNADLLRAVDLFLRYPGHGRSRARRFAFCVAVITRASFP